MITLWEVWCKDKCLSSGHLSRNYALEWLLEWALDKGFSDYGVVKLEEGLQLENESGDFRLMPLFWDNTENEVNSWSDNDEADEDYYWRNR